MTTDEKPNPDNYRYLCRDGEGNLIVGICADGTIEWTKDKNRAKAFHEAVIHSLGMLFFQTATLNDKLDLLLQKENLNPVHILGRLQ